MTPLELVNKVLLEMGERTVATLDENSASRKAYGMLQEVVDAVNFEHPWEELLVEQPLDELEPMLVQVDADHYAYLKPTKTHSVNAITNIDDNKVLQYVEYRNLRKQGSCWTIFKNGILVSPDVENTSRYYVSYYASFELEDDEELPVTTYLQSLYSKRLLLQYVTRHLNNFDFATAVYQEYAAALSVYNVTTKLIMSSREDSKPSFGEPYVNTTSQRSGN